MLRFIVSIGLFVTGAGLMRVADIARPVAADRRGRVRRAWLGAILAGFDTVIAALELRRSKRGELPKAQVVQ